MSLASSLDPLQDNPIGSLSGNFGAPHNLAISTLRDAGHHSIAAGLREISYTPFTRPLDLLGLA
ncbi:hypothetical protein OS965_14870 [Streptomyces sp. H27-G5]|uniref:hypothetical protein n=1 Tax=Streptomyces sp. H27-G5 TaxID=2996698 RepID=UPI00226F8F1D|nr:hypothetical protein [Streptomyces sp. H27-G5]MCY0919453.1 hypothetical protein [Streptomyces sp. H27-G5]